MAGKPNLSNLAGEIQNQIFQHLDPVTRGALRCVNGHFHESLALDRSKYSTERYNYLHAVETSTWHPRKDNFACHDCDKMKPKKDFSKTQTKGKRGKNGYQNSLRVCMACAVRQGHFKPGSVVKTNDGTESQIFCRACSTLQREWCAECRFCRKCAEKGKVQTWRKGQWAESPGTAGKVTLESRCILNNGKHYWEMSANQQEQDDKGWESTISGLLLGDASRVADAEFSPMQAMAMYDHYAEFGEMASLEWYDGPDDI
ncbi:MAG: hypothetical protein Q9205_005332 [Flavoplaca limonia]